MSRIQQDAVCAVFFDGAGLSRLGLEQAGWKCVGVELNPVAHHLSKMVGSGNCVLADVRDFRIDQYPALWASPPCQWRSDARTQGAPLGKYAKNLLGWSLDRPNEILWVENVMKQGKKGNDWGTAYNAAQFLRRPIQNRNRIIGGRYPEPKVFRPYVKAFPGICPCITASEYKGCGTDTRRASRFYGRRITVEEAAYHQGFKIPKGWYKPLPGYTEAAWMRELYIAIGNGVPPFMSRAFGVAALAQFMRPKAQVA